MFNIFLLLYKYINIWYKNYIQYIWNIQYIYIYNIYELYTIYIHIYEIIKQYKFVTMF